MIHFELIFVCQLIFSCILIGGDNWFLKNEKNLSVFMCKPEIEQINRDFSGGPVVQNLP